MPRLGFCKSVSEAARLKRERGHAAVLELLMCSVRYGEWQRSCPEELFAGSGMRSARYLLEGALWMLSWSARTDFIHLQVGGGADFVWANDANQERA